MLGGNPQDDTNSRMVAKILLMGYNELSLRFVKI